MSRPLYAPKETYVGTGSLDTYTFDFKIEAKDQLLVIETDDAGVETQRVRGTDVTYLTSVTFDAVDGAGTVVLAANLTTDYNLIFLLANDAPTQTYEFRNKGSFTLERFEAALDLVAGAVQRLAYRGKQAFRIHDLDNEETFNAQLPSGVAAATNRVIQVNAAGNGMIYGPTAAEISGAEASAIAAAASAAAALVSENAAAADLVLTNADVVSTGNDVTSTNADVVSTNADVVSTGNDVTSTNADVVSTNADAAATALDKIATNADVVLTGLDVVSTGDDVTATNADVVSTGDDVTATNADVVSTGDDVTATNADVVSAAASAAAAAVAAAASQWSDVAYITSASSPVTVADASAGTLYVVDTSGGAVIFNLPAISVLSLSTAWSIGIKIETSDANTVTVNRNGSDLFDQADTSVVMSRLNEGRAFIPDVDGSPDSWTTLQFGLDARENVVAKTATYTALTSDDYITVDTDTPWTLTLYTAVGNIGRKITVVKITSDLGALTIDAAGSETINGNLTTSVNTQYEKLTLISDGANWLVDSRKCNTAWEAFTPTGSWSTNTTYTGVKRRVEDAWEYKVKLAIAGVPTAATLDIDVPDGTIDTAKEFVAVSINATLGKAALRENGVGTYSGRITYASTTTVRVSFLITATNRFDDTNNAGPFTWGANDAAYIEFSVPIVGLKGSNE